MTRRASVGMSGRGWNSLQQTARHQPRTPLTQRACRPELLQLYNHTKQVEQRQMIEMLLLRNVSARI